MSSTRYPSPSVLGLTASRAVQTDSSGVLSVSTVTSTELGYISGVTSAVQTQLNAKQASGNYITALTGDVTASGPGSVAATLAATSNGTLVTLSRAAGVNVHGTNTNDSAAAGYFGEYIESVVGTTNAPADNTYGDLTSISLTAGDWDVTASMWWLVGSASCTYAEIGISTTSGNSATGLVSGSNNIGTIPPLATSATLCGWSIPNYRMSLSGTTTVYFKYRAAYPTGQPAGAGRLSARRVR